MVWNSIEAYWGELKGRAKRRLNVGNFGQLSTNIPHRKQLTSRDSEAHISNQTRADMHLANLHQMLKKMPHLDSTTDDMPIRPAYRNASDFNKK